MADPLSVATSLVAFISLTSQFLEIHQQVVGLSQGSISKFKSRRIEYGVFSSIFLQLFFPNALDVMEKVEKYVIPGQDHEVIAFMKSYTSSFTMIGVAGAIIAQVAITAMSLTRLDDSHWTAEAFFVISLVTGSLSVYFSCANSPSLHGLHNADDIRDFLTRPSKSVDLRVLNDLLTQREKATEVDEETIHALKQYIKKVASAHSAVMLVVPMYLLNIALGTFLTGLGVYLGKLYTADLIPSYGSGALGILIVYIVTALTGLAVFSVAQSFKYLENLPQERYNILLERMRKKSRRPAGGNERPGATHTFQSQGSTNTIQQSLHTRNNGRVSFVIDDHESANQPDQESDSRIPPPQTGHESAVQPDQESDSDFQPPRADVLDTLMRPHFSPNSGSLSQTLDAQNRSPSSDVAPTNNVQVAGAVQAALESLIKAQEEVLQASRRLQEALREHE